MYIPSPASSPSQQQASSTQTDCDIDSLEPMEPPSPATTNQHQLLPQRPETAALPAALPPPVTDLSRVTLTPLHACTSSREYRTDRRRSPITAVSPALDGSGILQLAQARKIKHVLFEMPAWICVWWVGGWPSDGGEVCVCG